MRYPDDSEKTKLKKPKVFSVTVETLTKTKTGWKVNSSKTIDLENQ